MEQTRTEDVEKHKENLILAVAVLTREDLRAAIYELDMGERDDLRSALDEVEEGV